MTVRWSVDWVSLATDRDWIRMNRDLLLEHGRNRVLAWPLSQEIKLKDGGRHMVVRLWNKTREHITGLFQRVRQMHGILPIDSLILSINGNGEQGGTWEALKGVRFPDEFPVIPLEIFGDPGAKEWTRGLNGPLAYLHSRGVRTGQMWNLSFEAQVNLEVLRGAAERIKGSNAAIPCISLREGPPNSAFVRNSLSSAAFSLHAAVRGLGQYDCQNLRWYVRNTCQIWGLEALFKYGGFNPRTNGTGGQEDTEYFLRVFYQEARISELANIPCLFYRDPRQWKDDGTWDAAGNEKKLMYEHASIIVMAEGRFWEMPFEPDFVW